MSNKHHLKIRLAQVAAKIIAEEGIDNFKLATQKAAERMGVKCQPSQLPQRDAVEEALKEHYRLYQSTDHPQRIQKLRQVALQAMQFLKEFSPHLVGSVLEGYASQFSPVTLHLYASTSEEVILKLDSYNIPHQQDSHEYKTRQGMTLVLPLIRFLVDGITLEIKLFPENAVRKANIKSRKQASIKELENLLQDHDSEELTHYASAR